MQKDKRPGVDIPDEAVMAAAGEVEYYGVDRHERDKAAREALEAAASFIVAAYLDKVLDDWYHNRIKNQYLSDYLAVQLPRLRGEA